ncbi:MAG: DNA-directed RNA polymerase subunit alpha [Candidatus Caenarcaniphilales bacterium]|nr:DNA-directed RNA polymerase subunit alpha [Candidatus Caenarcaniphilales bacterium]
METSIKCTETKKLEDGSILAYFEVEPLERGFGITLGNTFRRICLSHLEGTAITSAQIEGVTHEFSTMKGVAEDIVEIILNFKSLVFQTDIEEIFTVKIDFQGPGQVKGKDLILPAGVEIVNPEQHIATVTEERSFVAELTATKGKGYVLAEEQILLNKAIDVIPIDSSFMPIKRFSYKVEQIRIGESSEPSTNKYEKLIMEMVSNGSIDPEKAISLAAKLLVRKLNTFLALSGEGLPQAPLQEEEPEVVEDYSNVGIETLNLSVRAYNCLKRANKNTLQDILDMTTDELMGIKNFGKKSAEEVIQTLNDKGFFLADDPRRANQGSPSSGQKTAVSPAGGSFNPPPFGMILR